jgi:hypothetical protein
LQEQNKATVNKMEVLEKQMAQFSAQLEALAKKQN